ncbi:MAG: HipA N-terminal domain-containing protein [Thioalkalivibrio sp.]|nr:HipA N-terminal domain-containing protein [Thioalkalivibrio sp.]
MISEQQEIDHAYVWTWLPGEAEPVVAGRLMRDGERLTFTYGSSYRQRENAIPIYAPELPLRPGLIEPTPPLIMPGCIRDGSPDAWGRRVIINRLAGTGLGVGDASVAGELAYLLHSGSDRIGALDFQESATEYVPREAAEASLDDLPRPPSMLRQAGDSRPHSIRCSSTGRPLVVPDQKRRLITRIRSSLRNSRPAVTSTAW